MTRTGLARLPPWRALLLAWLPLAVLYPLAIGREASDPVTGVMYGLRTAIIGGLLVGVVWWLTGRLRWNLRGSARFYLAHLVAGLAFAFVWLVLAMVASAVQRGVSIGATVHGALTGPYVGWNLMLHFVVYGLMAGVSYALREGARAKEEQMRAARLDAVATRARLGALQARLNPHFLFNTLHSLSVLVRRDPALAEEALDRLGDLLRYALDHGGREDVALREECAFVEDYLALERIRLDARLRVELSLDERALPERVPPFCLQPLVENAIRHGLNPRTEGGTVWITVRLEPGALYMEVRDDGVGADPEHVAAAPGIGLDAIRRRVDAWEEGGTFHVETRPGAGFRVVLTLPCAAAAAVPAGLHAAELAS